jgi:hypothetical protein
MKRATSIIIALFFLGSLDASKSALASEDSSSATAEAKLSTPSETSQGRSVLGELAVALASGGEALSSFRGSTIEGKEAKDRLDPAIPDMDCSIDRIATYVTCYGSSTGSKEEADRRFVRIIDEMQAVLPSDRWSGAEMPPRIDSLGSYSYTDQNSGAHIDIDLIARPETEGSSSYLVTIFGWAATQPRLQ